MVKNALKLLLLSILFFSVFAPVFSQSVDDLEKNLNDKTQEVKEKESKLESIKKEIERISSSTASLDQKIVLIDKELKDVEKYISTAKIILDQKEKDLRKKEVLLAVSSKQLEYISYELYKTSRFGFLEYFFLNTSTDGIVQKIFYKQYLLSKYINEYKDKRAEYAQVKSEKNNLDKERKELENEIKQIEKLRSDLVAQKSEYLDQISYRNTLSSSLKSQITLLKGEISQLQIAILTAKSGGYLSATDVPSGGSGSLAKFNSEAKSGEFGVFSFGAYTHRNGMSQWGAKARADSGQSYTQILSAYYPGKTIRTGSVVIGGKSREIMTKIKTTTGEILDFENEYLMRLAEMPESWDLDALKAQAIAARTYAVNYTGNGSKAICVTQSCQVIGNKKTGAWKTAVEQTKGMILTNNDGTTFSAQYAAVHGGWVNNVGWDTKTKKGLYSAWTKDAWDSISGVSWFYQAWSTINNSSCNEHSKPWLTPPEMVDILNVYLVLKRDGVVGSVNESRILPITLPYCQISGLSGNPYSMEDIKALLSKPVTSITSAPVVNQGSNGVTQSISFVTIRGGNREVVTISGNDFKQVFNMRAPGYLSIPQNNYVFIDVLKKI